ncbi:UDP-N-acetylglucosamine 1-carboxyvinyltransferase [Alicyclobacillus herbarius]|uniref:UDP-N-acetylglucosamine 1-carboxyvinyltransferase n=1 Tax=Alicyclobacillus herbarius TaxID=122960 RepID=UPI003081108E
MGVEALEIHGGRPLSGQTRIYGAKNAALPILAATVMVEGTCEIQGVPDLQDVRVMCEILGHLGAHVERRGDTLIVDSRDIRSTEVPLHLMRQMRSSIFLMGPLLARFGEVTISKPGGCVIGQRPIDYHLRGIRMLGVTIEEQHGFIRCTCNRLMGTTITLDFPSVGATENLIMAAVLSDGQTVLENVAREPEVVDLARFLNRSGARIEGAGGGTILVDGVHHLQGCGYRVIPDRIVAGTMLIAAAATGGEVELLDVESRHLGAVISKLREAGVEMRVEPDRIVVLPGRDYRGVNVRTAPYPGFPTDLQAPLTAFLTTAQGISVVKEDIFEARFKHADELARMGADITVDLRAAVVRGVPRLSGAVVEASDLRGGAALVIAGLMADGETRVEGCQHIDRGYQQLEVYLRDLGAAVERVVLP